MDVILTRQSIRKYTNELINEEDITKLLKAGFQAPSACNQQPWEFLVVDQKDILEKLSKTSGGAHMLKDASHAIIVIKTETEARPRMAPQDCAAATQNILLKAHELGLGAVWIGVYPLTERMEYINPILNIPSNKQVFSMISLGHPNETRKHTLRYDESKVKWNRY